MRLRLKAAAASVAAAGVTLLGATAASAAPVRSWEHHGHGDRHSRYEHHHGHHGHHGHFGPVTATTYLAGRPDSGGNGNWASDRFRRTLTLTPEGFCSGGGYAYRARLSDSGTFLAIKGAYTPNQGAPYTGKLVERYVRGDFSGFGDFGTFCASNPASDRYVPHFVYGAADPSSTWPELAFPGGTTFTGVSENQWGYFYHGDGQRWADTAWNGDGQQPADGNISG